MIFQQNKKIIFQKENYLSKKNVDLSKNDFSKKKLINQQPRNIKFLWQLKMKNDFSQKKIFFIFSCHKNFIFLGCFNIGLIGNYRITRSRVSRCSSGSE